MGEQGSKNNIQNEIKQLKEELKLLKNFMAAGVDLNKDGEDPGTQPRLYGNRPNPFAKSTIIRYFVPQAGNQRISLFIVDDKGDQKMFLDYLEAGKQKLLIRDHVLGPGIYFCSLVVDGNIVETCKMEVVKAQ